MWRCVNKETLPLPTLGSRESCHLFPTTWTESRNDIRSEKNENSKWDTSTFARQGQYLSAFQRGRLIGSWVEQWSTTRAENHCTFLTYIPTWLLAVNQPCLVSFGMPGFCWVQPPFHGVVRMSLNSVWIARLARGNQARWWDHLEFLMSQLSLQRKRTQYFS
jgi:hypothetical protein